jgi:hypothetical protein
MSDLQLGLLGIGVLVVVAVLAYNKWQELKLRRRAEAAFASHHRDVLVEERGDAAGGQRGSPAWMPGPEGGRVERVEHTLDTPAPEALGVPEDQHAAPAGGTLDAAVDFIVEFDAPRALAALDIAHHARGLADDAFAKPVRWEGRDDARGDWRLVADDGSYRHVRAGLQLADRSGAVSEADLTAFARGAQEVALALGARCRMPGVGEGLTRAQELDRFCTDVDVLIGLSVIGSESHAFPGTKIRAAAEDAGLVFGKDGRLHCFDDPGVELFALANLEPMPFHVETMKVLQTRGVTALFDVPRVPPSDAAFRRFIDFAHELEQTLGGVLVDDNRKPIGQAALEAIGQELDRIHATMDERGIPAGSALALRLFT